MAHTRRNKAVYSNLQAGTLKIGHQGTAMPLAAVTDLGGTLTGTTDGALADVTGVDGTGNTAASKVDVDTNFKEVQAKLNTLLARLRSAGIIA